MALEQCLHGTGATVRRYSTSKEQWLRGRGRAKRSYSTFKVRSGEEIAVVRRYPTSKVKETQVKRYVLQEARRTETIITEN